MTPFSIIFTIAVAISLFLVFEIIYNLRRQKRTERLLTAFSKATTEFGLSISKQDVSGNRVTGFDEVNNKLLYLQLTDYKQDGYLVDLDEVKSCTVKKTYSPFWNGWTKTGVLVQTIALQFTYKNGAKPLLLLFYSNKTDPAFKIKEKAEQARKWQVFLSARLAENSNVASGRNHCRLLNDDFYSCRIQLTSTIKNGIMCDQ